jgi:hypothetical protein
MTQPQTTTGAHHVSSSQPDIPELALFDRLMAYLYQWTFMRQRYHAQFARDADLTEREIDNICQQLQRTAVLALALRELAARLEQEADDTTDRFYTWYYD